jgi:hypothetical protein
MEVRLVCIVFLVVSCVSATRYRLFPAIEGINELVY